MAIIDNQKLLKALNKIEQEMALLPPRVPVFIAYDPHMTFNSSVDEFINYRGTILKIDDEFRPLFRIGKRAFNELCSGISREDFIVGVHGYKSAIKEFAEIFKRREALGGLVITNRSRVVFDWDECEDEQILDILWQTMEITPGAFEDDMGGFIMGLFLMNTLIGINDVLISKDLGIPTVSQTIDLMESFSRATTIGSRKEIRVQIKKDMASKGADARLQNDPKEAAMKKIEAEHEALKPHQKTWGYLAPFSRAMQEKYSSILVSPISIERRITKLKKRK